MARGGGQFPTDAEVRVRFIADTKDIEKKLDQAVEGKAGGSKIGKGPPRMPSGGGGGAGGGFAGGFMQSIKHFGTSIMSMLNPLSHLKAIAITLAGLALSSNIMRTYMAGVGKMIGAAVDMLLMPFIPFLNLIMMGMSKLIQTIYSSGVLDQLSAFAKKLTDWAVKIWDILQTGNFVKAITTAIGDAVGWLWKVIAPIISNTANKVLSWLAANLPSLIWKGIKAVVKGGVKATGESIGGAGKGRGLLDQMEGWAKFIDFGRWSTLFSRSSPSPFEDMLAGALQRTGGLNIRGVTPGYAGAGGGSRSVVLNQNVSFNIPLRERVEQSEINRYLGDWSESMADDVLRGI